MKSKILPWQRALCSCRWNPLEQVGPSPSHFFFLSARYRHGIGSYFIAFLGTLEK